MKVTELCDAVQEELASARDLKRRLSGAYAGADDRPSRADVDAIVLMTIRAMGFDVSKRTGKIRRRHARVR